MKHKLLFTLIAWCVSLGLLFAQGRTISGTVTDAGSKEPIPGVSVYIKGTTTGVSTDGDGKYQLPVPNATGDILVYSLVGYKNQEITLGAEAEVNVSLVTDGILDEVVVTALGIEKDKKGLGIAVTEVKAADIQNTRATNVVNSLSARVAGVRVQGSSGMVGSSSAIFIRGFTTFTGSNQPLFVVDGIPIDNSSTGYGNTGGALTGNALQTGVSNSNRAIDINPDDIESMSVLKGPAAAVLYGSRAAGGAILITTKKGKSGKLKIDYTGSYQVVDVNRYPDYQNDYGQGIGGAMNNTSNFSWGPRFGSQPTYTNFIGQSEIYQAYPNNVESLFKQGNNLQNSLSISGGNDKSTFTASYSNTLENGIMINNRLHRNTFKIGGTHQLTKKISVSTSINYFNIFSKRTQQGNQLSNPMFRSWFLPRSVNPYNYPTINPTNGAANYWYGGEDNPIWSLENHLYDDEVNRVLGNISFTYDITDWMSLNYKLGTDYGVATINTYDAPGARGAANHNALGVGAIGRRANQTTLTSSFLNLNFKKKINEDFTVTGLLGQEISSTKGVNRLALGTGVVIPGFYNLSNTTTYVPTNSEVNTRLMGIYVDVQASFRDFAFLNVTGRNDRSSTFGPAKRSYFYPSVSASFVFTSAIEALKENNVISFGRIRGNLAQVGRIAPAYSTDTYFLNANPSDGFGPAITFPFVGQAGRALDDVAGNPNLGPEFTVTREIGTELKFLKNRITLDLGYFSTNSTKIILDVPVAGASGFTNLTNNAGKLNSNGIELLLAGTPIKKENFQWDISLNWTRIRNVVKELAPGVTIIPLGGFTSPQTRLEANAPYGVIYGTTFIRHTDGRLILNPNGLPVVNTTDIKRIGDPNPDWTAGITNTLSYKGLSLSFLVDIRKGGDIVSRNIGDLRRAGAAAETGDRDRNYNIAGWKGNAAGTLLADAGGNPVANDVQVTAEQFWGSMFAFGTGESYIFDASWVRLREASLTYTLPQSIVEKAKLSRIEIGISGRNLLLWAPNVPHIDPEVNAQGANNSQGLEFNALPQTRSLGFMLRISY